MSAICHGSTKLFYVNGMTTTKAEAQKSCREIERMTQRRVHLLHNNTTPGDKTIEASVKIFVGAVGLSYAIASEKKSKSKKIIDGLVGAGSLALIVSGIIDYVEIQQKKNALADQLAQRVVRVLEKDPCSSVALILHSQGADIGQRALRELNQYRDRIDVVTLGGMVTIPHELANRVHNFQDDSDGISQMANVLFNIHPGQKTKTMISTEQCNSHFCHGSLDYLSNGEVRKLISALTLPKMINVGAHSVCFANQ